MSKSFLLLLLSCVCFHPTLHAEQTISLKDGSQIKGDLVGVNNGVYTVKSATLGQVSVDAAQVNTISNLQAATAPAVANTAQAPTEGQIQAMQSQIMSDPQIMGEIESLIQDPEIMKMLSDPALIQAAMAKDTAAVENNPQAQALMQNPKLRGLIEKIQQQK